MFNNTTIFKHFQSRDHKMTSLSIRSILLTLTRIKLDDEFYWLSPLKDILISVTALACSTSKIKHASFSLHHAPFCVRK